MGWSDGQQGRVEPVTISDRLRGVISEFIGKGKAMANIDDMIKDATTGKEEKIIISTEELGYFSLARSLFSGKLGWVAWVIMLAQSAMFIVGAWAAWRFYIAEDVLMALKWGISSAVVLLMGAQMKLSFMPQLQANRILRELKRVELLVLNRTRED